MMRKYLVLVCCLFFIAVKSNAQYVNIPDSNFRSFLIQKYPACFNGAGLMDTTCSSITNETTLWISSIGAKNIDEVKYFKKLTNLHCNNNLISNLPALPDSIDVLWVQDNLLKQLPVLPLALSTFECSNNQLLSLPNLPKRITYLNCSNNSLIKLPELPISLYHIYCNNNKLTELPELKKLINLFVFKCQNNLLTCLPYLPFNINYFETDVQCVPNIIKGYYPNFHPPICNPTNNSNNCHPYPTIQSYVYTDVANKFPKQNIKLNLSNSNHTYTNLQGIAYNSADSLGTYTITPTAPNFYNAVPSSYTHNFTSYDTLVIDTFALQPTVIKDSISIKLTPTNWAARPGRSYPYLVSYENVGTTVLSTPIIHFNYDSSLLIYDSSSVSGVTNNGNNLSLNIGNVVPGQTGNFVPYFTVKTTASLGSNVTSVVSIATNTVNATDTITTQVRGSFDPNDKQATPNLSVAQVADNNHWIDYTIRFENTGNDTAFTVVVADTLDVSKLQVNTIQITGSSHNVNITQNTNVVFFEFRNIYLPDSNINKIGSNGFVSFKAKPLTNLTNGTLVPNTASIYFDYNSPVVTNTAHTLIGNTLPVTLVSFNAIPKENENKIFVYWNTANEINTSFFLIEQSVDGRTFKPVVEIAAKGIGSNSYFYSIAKNNIAYLRLKMVDKNGTFTYSNIIKLAEDKSNGFDIVSNPAKVNLNVKVYSPSLNNTIAKIVNVQGQIVKTFMLKQNLQTIDIAALQRGAYYLQTTLGSKKFVVE